MLLRNDRKIVIGYDLANTCSQISYCYQREDSDIETLVAVDGEENYDIPMVLCKRIGTNQWLYGHAAMRFAKEKPEEGILVDGLLKLALGGEIVQIDGKGYQPAALLALFVKRSLDAIIKGSCSDKIAAIVFTSRVMDERMETLIRRIVKTLEFKNVPVRSQYYEESFFAYLTGQQRQLWQDGALLMDYRGQELVAVHIESNQNTIPKVMYSVKKCFSFSGTDKELLDFAKLLCEGKSISAVYLIGEKFGGEWMEESLKYLCTGRRVFQGTNLYSKGACYSVLNEQNAYLFLGPDKLKANVGMKIRKRGEDTYSALLDAGMYWKGLDENFEFYLKGESNLELILTPLTNAPSRMILVELEGLDLKEDEVTRVRLKLDVPQENVLRIMVSDLGFGEFRENCGGKWVKEVEV